MIRVEATAQGFFDNFQKEVGDVFDLHPREGRFTEPVLDAEGAPKMKRGTLAEHPVTVKSLRGRS